jgi:hypothetical protein
MKHKEHFRTAVYPTPFHPRTSQLNVLNEWHRWKDYTTADAYYDEALEYSAIRNACAVFDLTPMTKHRITGPDALAFLNRLVTRDVAKMTTARSSMTERSSTCARAIIASARRSVSSTGWRARRSASTCRSSRTRTTWRRLRCRGRRAARC